MRALLLALALTLATAPAAGAKPLMAPYLQGGTATTMTVMWQSDRPTPARVVATDARGKTVVALGHTGTGHELHLVGLTAGTPYRYEAYEGDALVGSGTFHTSPTGDVPVRFAVFGDSGSGNANQYAVAKQLAAWKPEFVLVTGDVVYERGEAEGYQARFFKPYAALLGNTVFYPTLGNHDYGTGHATAYEQYFDVPGARGNERWYTFTYGPVQFFALDSNMPYGKTAPQTRWLESELKKSTAPWKIAFFHHPPYASGWEGSSVGLRRSWGPLFEKYDAQVVFSGHDHDYERIKPREDFVKDGRPTTYVVTGGGGAWLRDVHPQAFTAVAKKAYHFMGVTVEGDRLIMEAIDKTGQVLDRDVVQR